MVLYPVRLQNKIAKLDIRERYSCFKSCMLQLLRYIYKTPECVDMIRGTSQVCMTNVFREKLMMYGRLYQHTRVVLYIFIQTT